MFRISTRQRIGARCCLKTRHLFSPALEVLESRLVPSGDMVLRWNAVALDAVKNDYAVGHTPDQGGPTRASRALAIVQSAIYDTVEAIDHTYEQFLVHVNAPKGTSMDAAVAMAGHDTLVALFPQQKTKFDVALMFSLQGIAPQQAVKGTMLGHYVAMATLAARQNDGSASAMPYTPGTEPGDWQPDPLHPNQQALTPGWGEVTPFTLTSGSQFQVPAPPALTSTAYAEAFNEVKSLGGDGVNTPTTRTPEQTIIGLFWAYDGSPGIGVPPRLYNQIARAIVIQKGNTEVQNARLFALLNIAMADTGIAVWDTKYVYNFWRPITAIRNANLDNNADTTADAYWTPLGAPADNGGGTNFTPPFPAYTSGHAGFGAAAFGILRDFYGTDNISFSFMSDEFNGVTKDQNGNVRPKITRHFDTLSQAIEENGQSRIYLGIHWKFDKIEGIQQGTQIADWVFGHIMQTKAPALATLAPTTELMSALFGNANEAASFNPQGFFVTGVHTTMTEFPMNQFTMNAATAPPAVPAMTLGESPATRTDTDAIDEVFRALDDIHALWNISDR